MLSQTLDFISYQLESNNENNTLLIKVPYEDIVY